MLKILKAYSIPDQLVNAISRNYENTKVKVISPNGETDLFNILVVVLQSDTLAPYLFVVVVDHALRMVIEGQEEELGFHLVKRRSTRIGPVVMALDFADDIFLISDEIEQAQKIKTAVFAVG